MTRYEPHRSVFNLEKGSKSSPLAAPCGFAASAFPSPATCQLHVTKFVDGLDVSAHRALSHVTAGEAVLICPFTRTLVSGPVMSRVEVRCLGVLELALSRTSQMLR
jgi:hypothetical protein